MAQFKEATLANGDKIIINIELIRTMQRFADTTTIEIGDDYAVQIKEAPNYLISLSAEAASDVVMRRGSLPQS